MAGNAPGDPDPLPHELDKHVGSLIHANKFHIENNTLLYQEQADKRPVVAVPCHRQLEVLEIIHKNVGHAAARRSLMYAKTFFWWIRMPTDVINHIKGCVVCAVVNGGSKVAKQPLQPLPPATQPGMRIHADLVSLGAKTAQCASVLTVVDAHSKLIAAFPLLNETAQATLLAMQSYVSAHGCPKILVTDQGGQFCSALFQAWLLTTGINHITTSTHAPQANGLVERQHRTLIEMLRKKLAENPEHTMFWPHVLLRVVLEYNTAASRVTKYTPFELHYGRLGMTPNMLPVQRLQTEGATTNQVTKVIDCQATVALAHDVVRSHIEAANAKMALGYNRKWGAKAYHFMKGQRCWLYDHNILRSKDYKLKAPYTGPHLVMNVNKDNTAVELRRPDMETGTWVSTRFVKPVHYLIQADILWTGSNWIQLEQPYEYINPPKSARRRNKLIEADKEETRTTESATHLTHSRVGNTVQDVPNKGTLQPGVKQRPQRPEPIARGRIKNTWDNDPTSFNAASKINSDNGQTQVRKVAGTTDYHGLRAVYSLGDEHQHRSIETAPKLSHQILQRLRQIEDERERTLHSEQMMQQHEAMTEQTVDESRREKQKVSKYYF